MPKHFLPSVSLYLTLEWVQTVSGSLNRPGFIFSLWKSTHSLLSLGDDYSGVYFDTTVSLETQTMALCQNESSLPALIRNKFATWWLSDSLKHCKANICLACPPISAGWGFDSLAGGGIWGKFHMNFTESWLSFVDGSETRPPGLKNYHILSN